MELKKAELTELKKERNKRIEAFQKILEEFHKSSDNCAEVIGWNEYYTSYESASNTLNRLSKEHFGGEIKARTRMKGVSGRRNERGHIFLVKNIEEKDYE